jgi:preprotein translocase subunit SecD
MNTGENGSSSGRRFIVNKLETKNVEKGGISMRKRNLIIFMIILVIFVVAAFVVFPLGTQNGGALGSRPLKVGLDLQGGVRLSYHADFSGIDKSKWQSALSSDIPAISNRINALGVAEPVIQQHGDNVIVVELPGYSDVQTARQVIGETAVLEFGELTLKDDKDVKWTVGDQYWKPATGALNGKQVELTSAYFQQNTNVNVSSTGGIVVQFQWNSDGSTLSREITTRLLNKPLGIFSGDKLISSPNVIAVISNSGEITGMSQTEATQLSKLLNAGIIPVPLVFDSQSTKPLASAVGENFINLSFKAAIISLVLIMLFMSMYYRVPGVMASLALLFYATTVLMIYKLIPVTLSLAGIGGFVLSLGMAVDANVLIFERLKEELRAGRTVGAAIEAGFKRAWTAIWDTHVTTFVACIIMFWLGSNLAVSSVIAGFAFTLGIGVVVSLFSAFFVTQTFLRLFEGAQISQRVKLFTILGGK